jgi:succinate-acetate transporter protein
MATVSPPLPVSRNGAPAQVTYREVEHTPVSTGEWGNSAPLGLFAMAVTTFMLSMVNADAIAAGVQPVVIGVALMFGGLILLVAAIIQLRTGATFAGVMFAGFSGFYLSLFAIVQWYLKEIPPALVGHALGLFLYGFAIFALVMLAASFRTNVVIVAILMLTVALLFLLGAGNYGADTTMIHWGGYLGLAVTACLFYLALANMCEISYGRPMLPLGHLDKS